MGWLGAIWWAAAAAGLTAAGLSTAAAAEQGKWASEVGAEIDQRLDTQDLNSDTMDMYTEEVDTYAGFMQNVEELEIAIPDDVETVEDTSAGTTTAGTTAGTTTSTTTGSQSATDTTSSTSTTSKDNDDKDDKLKGGGESSLKAIVAMVTPTMWIYYMEKSWMTPKSYMGIIIESKFQPNMHPLLRLC
jgi:hypothetical protein